MPYVYVMTSPQLSVWARKSGLGESVVKIGFTKEDVRMRHLEIKVAEYGGVKDWRWNKSSDVPTKSAAFVEEQVHLELRGQDKWLDPSLYPQLVDEYGRPSTELFLVSEDEAVTLIRQFARQASKRGVQKKRPPRARVLTFRRAVVLLALLAAIGLYFEVPQKIEPLFGTRNAPNQAAKPPAKSPVVAPSVSPKSNDILSDAPKPTQPKPMGAGDLQQECFIANKDLSSGKTVQHRICMDADGVWRDKGTVR